MIKIPVHDFTVVGKEDVISTFSNYRPCSIAADNNANIVRLFDKGNSHGCYLYAIFECVDQARLIYSAASQNNFEVS